MNILTASATGEKNKIKRQNSQDYINYEVLNNGMIVAIADGHSGDEFKYSYEGARFATESANEILKNIYKYYYEENGNIDSIENLLDNNYIQNYIYKSWRSKVDRHYKAIFPVVFKTNYFKYGTTLIALLYSKDFNIYIHIGDGDIIINEGVFYKRGIDPKKEKNQIYVSSLCMDDCIGKFNIKFEIIHNNNYDNIILFSDGFSNSFMNDYSMYYVLSKYKQKLRYKAYDVERDLKSYIDILSQNNSRDDISIAFIY